jgi:hypothetical protein
VPELRWQDGPALAAEPVEGGAEPRLLHQCWEGESQLPDGVSQRKYVEQGNWLTVFDSDRQTVGARQGLATSADGTLYVAYSMDRLGLVHALSARAELVWSRNWRGEGNVPYAVILLPSGDLLVGGEYVPQEASCDGAPETRRRAYVTRFEPDGEETWTFTFGGPREFNRVMGLAVGPGDIVYASGQTDGAVSFGAGVGLSDIGNRNQFLLALDVGELVVRWAWSLGAIAARGDGPTLAATPDGGVIASGTTDVGFVTHVDVEGTTVWSRVLPQESVMRSSVDSRGHAWTTVIQSADEPSRKDWLVRFDGHGIQQSIHPLVSPLGGVYRVWGVLSDADQGELAITNYGMAPYFADTRDMAAQTLFIPRDGAQAQPLTTFALWEMLAAAPVRSADGAVVTSGSFTKPSTFGLDLGAVDVVGYSNLYVLWRNP